MARANKPDRAAVSWTEPGSYASLKDVVSAVSAVVYIPSMVVGQILFMYI